MKIFLNDVRNQRQLKSLIGLSREEFDKLLEAFSVCLEETKNKKYRKNKKSRKRRPGGGRTGSLETPENKLFFILYYLKNYPTFDVLGFIFDINPSKAHENVKKLIPILKSAQKTLRALPKQRFKNANEFSQVVEKTKNIAIDATEREHFRHQNNKQQRQHFSGKKQRHTVKNTVIASCSCKGIFFVGKTVPGSRHDYALFKQEFDPHENWFKSVTASVDLGYQGIKKDYLSPKNIHIPHKKPRKSKCNPTPSLTTKQRKENKLISRTRIAVEHAIGGMKSFHILTIKFRNRLKNFSNEAVLLCAGLWNLKKSFVVQ
jgi:hypothetical protein